MGIMEDRRALHRIPETDWNLPKTKAYLQQALSELGCTLLYPVESSVCAWFDFGAKDAIAFRSDMDALPIQERTDLPFASEHPGNMHACGHDGHMAILLELARRLSTKKQLNHNVLLIFQPAEETTGGAKPICDTGILARYGVKAVFGLHLWPGLEAGTIASRPREMMSRACVVYVDIYGKSAHLARSQEGIDAMAAAVDFYQQITELEQSLPNHVLRLLKFGKFISGTVGNAVAAHARLEGSLRTFDDEVFFTLRDRIREIQDRVASTSGCRVEVYMNEGYPAVWNEEALFRQLQDKLPISLLPQPSMISEDFSWYQRSVPGVFFFLGLGDSPALHADTFCFDENILLRGADFFEKITEELV